MSSLETAFVALAYVAPVFGMFAVLAGLADVFEAITNRRS